MTQDTSKQITKLENVLANFITEQREFNTEQREFNVEQREFNAEQRKFNAEQIEFNVQIDKKIDKVQYFLEESIAENTKMFFEEQIKVKSHVKELEIEVLGLKDDLLELTAQFHAFQKSC